MYWWVELGYPDAFDLGRDGFFPRPGQVVKHYRERKMNDKGKAWTQKNLAKTLGISDTAVRNIELRDIGMDDFGRRQFLSKLFAIPPILLGIMTPGEIAILVERQRSANSVGISTPTATSRRHVVDIQAHYEQLADLLAATIHTEQSPMATALAGVDELYRELAYASQEQADIQSLLCDYHQFISILLCDDLCDYDTAIEHLNKAFQFAAFRDEQKALVFQRRGLTLWKADRVDESLIDFGRAWQFERKLPNNLRGLFLLESSRARAQHATTKQDRSEILRSIDLVGGMIRGNHQEEDPHLTQLDLDCYHLYRSSVLITIGWNKEATQELGLINRFSQYPSRQVYYDILQAQAYTNRGMYELAAPLLEYALTTAQEANSAVNIARVVKVFQQLQQSPYKDSPDVARIDYLLYKKPRVQKP